MAYNAGITINVNKVDDTMPPTIGAAIRRMTSEPVPVLHKIGNKPAIIAVTVITLGRKRSAAPVIKALYKSISLKTLFCC